MYAYHIRIKQISGSNKHTVHNSDFRILDPFETLLTWGGGRQRFLRQIPLTDRPATHLSSSLPELHI